MTMYSRLKERLTGTSVVDGLAVGHPKTCDFVWQRTRNTATNARALIRRAKRRQDKVSANAKKQTP